MTCLNWALKFHIRLRNISYLIPTHITHVYVQEMPYSFVWLYMLKHMLISLATHSQVSWVVKNACFAKIGLKSDVFFKNFSVSLTSRGYLFVFSASASLKTSIVTSKTFIFISNLYSKSLKRYGFSLIFTLFQV